MATPSVSKTDHLPEGVFSTPLRGAAEKMRADDDVEQA